MKTSYYIALISIAAGGALLIVMLYVFVSLSGKLIQPVKIYGLNGTGTSSANSAGAQNR